VQWRFSKLLLSCLGTWFLVGCASEAPPLPADTTSVNRVRDLTLGDFTPEARAMSCDDIVADRHRIDDDMQKLNDTVNSNRSHNETLVGFSSFGGIVFAPLLLATESNDTEKGQIAQLYERRDTLIKLASLKHCPLPTAS